MRTKYTRGARLKVAASIGLAAFIGMGSLAAASPGVSTTGEPTLEPAPTNDAAHDPDPAAQSPHPTADEPAPEAVDAPETDSAEPSDDIAVPSDKASDTCLTHGQRVSEIAHSTPPGPGHGAAVSAAAHDHEGDCTHEDVAEIGEEPPSEPAEVLQPTTVAPAPAGPVIVEHGEPDRSSSQQGNGHGNGGGHGKG